MNRPTFVSACALCLLCLAVGLVSGVLLGRHWPSDEGDSFAAPQTRLLLQRLLTVCRRYQIDHNDFPGSLRDLEPNLRLFDHMWPTSTFDRDSEGRVNGCRDAWGRPLAISFTADGVIVFRSAGANGKDDGGLGDDIVVIYDYWREKARAKETPKR